MRLGIIDKLTFYSTFIMLKPYLKGRSMGKTAGLVTALTISALALTGCERSPEAQAAYEAAQREALAREQEAARQKAAAESKVCRVNVDLRQSRVSLNLMAHAKDSMNAAQFPLPTSCARVSALKPGDNLVDKFRTGSFLVSGSFGDWKMKVEDIPAVAADADKRSCHVQMELSQSRFSLDLTQHVKDAFNTVEFNWDLPGNIYDTSNEGQDFSRDGFRAGSFLLRGSYSDWSLKLKKKLGCQPS